MFVEHPTIALEEFAICTLEKSLERFQVDHWSIWASNNVLVLVEQVARIQSAETIRVLLEIFALFACGSLTRPAEHLLVSVELIGSVEVLQESVQPGIVGLTSVVVMEDCDDLGCVGRLSEHPLSFLDGPHDPAAEHRGNRNVGFAAD